MQVTVHCMHTVYKQRQMLRQMLIGKCAVPVSHQLLDALSRPLLVCTVCDLCLWLLLCLCGFICACEKLLI